MVRVAATAVWAVVGQLTNPWIVARVIYFDPGFREHRNFSPEEDVGKAVGPNLPDLAVDIY
jgi:hypothetical protein